MMTTQKMASIRPDEIPRGNNKGFKDHLKRDLIAGFLVFLIALPLCLGIAVACGYPPIAGIFTAIIGSFVATALSDSELTIKGPAAGLIVIAIGCIEDFGGDGIVGGFGQADIDAYRIALGIGVAAAVLQILFGVFRAGILGEFFPLAAVHGMLAAIGVIIVAKQLPVALGVNASGEPLELLAQIPRILRDMNPEIATIGGLSLLIMFVWPLLARRFPRLGLIPSPMVVLLVAVPIGMTFDLTHHHAYTLFGSRFEVGEEFLVSMPDRPFGMFDDVTFPDFSGLATLRAWKWVLLFFVIGNLESILSAKAIDIIDPWKRKTNLDRDVIAVGTGNLLSALVGGLPMISEIVRSKANIDNGAQTRFAGMWHGVFLLLCVGLIPAVLHLIPLSALAAMLVYTGFRLAHPTEFAQVKQLGLDQLLIFVVTLLAVLGTDLLMGIGIGIATKFALHLLSGVRARDLLRPNWTTVARDAETAVITVHQAAVFSNWIPLKLEIERLGLAEGKSVVVDVSGATLVDHSVMEKLHQLRREFARQDIGLEISGLDLLQRTASSHALAARKRGLNSMRRLTVVCTATLEEPLEHAFVERGATGFTASACRGAGRRILQGGRAPVPLVRIEVIVPNETSDSILDYLRRQILPLHTASVSVETVEVLRADHYTHLPRESRAKD